MREPLNFNLNADDLSAYNDEKIADYLKSLREKSLEELLAAQMKIGEEYARATEAYEAERTQIRWARRRYWLLIFIGVFQEIWRVLVQHTETKISKLKQKKADLKEKYRDQDEKLHKQLSIAHDSIDTINMYSDEINQRTKELAVVKTVLEQVDTQYHQLESGGPRDKEAVYHQLLEHIEQRDILNSYIFSLHKKIEDLVNGLAGLLEGYVPDYIPKDFLSEQREMCREKLADLKERCDAISHPLIPKLLAFLSHQTVASLQALQTEIAKSKDIFQNRQLGDVLWDANAIYPTIFMQQNREQTLLDFLELKDNELAALQAVIESTDRQLQHEYNPDMRKTLDKLVGDRDKLTAEISNLLLLHRDIVSGDHAELLKRLHDLARQHSENATVCGIKSACDRLQHPVTKALRYFLIYRTEMSLQELKQAMGRDRSHLESRELVQIIESAGKIDPRITEGWVKEMELPSIKDIQQHYFHTVANSLGELNAQYDALTDKRVALAEEMQEIKDAIQRLDQDLFKNTGISGQGYIPRAEMAKIREKGLEDDYKELRACITRLNALKQEMATLTKEIQQVSAEQDRCAIEPVQFTPEVLQALIEKCKQVKFLGRVHPVTNALIHFLTYSTPSLLGKLKMAMHEHPDYQKNAKITELLREANAYFPYIHHDETMSVHQGLFKFFQDHYSSEVSDNPRASRRFGRH